MEYLSPHAEELAKGIEKKEIDRHTLDGELKAREISREEYDKLVSLLTSK
jgi:hypothetical protein